MNSINQTNPIYSGSQAYAAPESRTSGASNMETAATEVFEKSSSEDESSIKDIHGKIGKIKEKISQTAEDFGNEIASMADSVADKAKSIAHTAVDKAVRLKEKITRAFNPVKLETGDGNDVITMRQDLAGNLIVTVNGEEKTYTPEEAKRLVIESGAGDDLIFADGSVNYNLLIKAGSGDNIIQGGRGDDVIKAGNGNNEIYGGRGDDKIKVGSGNNLIHGEQGDDKIVAGKGNNVIFGHNEEDLPFSGHVRSNFDESVIVGGGNNVIVGGYGKDKVLAVGGSNIISTPGGGHVWETNPGQTVVLEAMSTTTGGNLLSGFEYEIGGGGNETVNKSEKQKPIIVRGTNGDDSISITQQENGYLSVNVNGKMTNYKPADAKNLVFMTGSGNDAIIADKSVKYNLSIHAGSGNNVIQTGSGNDFISVGNGNNKIMAGKGNDVIIAGGGNNFIDSGTGNDVVTAGNGSNRIVSGKTEGESAKPDAGNDIINAGGGGNEVSVGNGTNVINLGKGDDKIQAGNGKNVINAAGGDNSVIAGKGNSIISVGKGDDMVSVGNGNNIIFAKAGDNKISAGNGKNKIRTGNGDDSISVGNGNNRIETRDGKDSISAGDGNNYVNSGKGDDFITVGKGNNVIYGLEGNDKIKLGNGDNMVFGGSGDDQITAGLGHNIISAGAGNDQIDASKGHNKIFDDGDMGNIFEGSNKKNDVHLYKPGENSNLGSSIRIKSTDEEGRYDPDFKSRVESDLELFRATESGQKMLKALDSSWWKKVTITKLGEETDNGFATTKFGDLVYVKGDGTPNWGTSSKISYNPAFYDTLGGTDFLPPVVLFHEMAHSYNHITGTMQPGKTYGLSGKVNKSEHQAVGLYTDGIKIKHPDGTVTEGNPKGLSENSLREDLGLPERNHY